MATIKKPAKKMQEGGKVKIKIKIKPDRKQARENKDKAPLIQTERFKDAGFNKSLRDIQRQNNPLRDIEMKYNQTGNRGMKKGGTIKKMQMGGKEPKKKTGMDALKAVGKYVSTFGGATERDDPKQKDINIVKKLKETGNKVKNKLGLKSGGAVKAKNGKSFPDLNKDGKITKADILKGRGVIAKKGASIKKAQTGNNIKVNPPAGYTKGSGYKSFGKSGVSVKKMQYGGAAASMVPPMMKKGGTTKKCKYGCK